MTRLVVGVMGHVDHGKTALVRALTGQETDRLPQEKSRGISIALGFAHFQSPAGATVDLIDMPGHQRFVATMISGATGIDAVLLVVAANEGIKAQTIEHANVAHLMDMRRAVVAITKADLATTDEARAVAEQAAAWLTRRGFDPPPVIVTSAARGQGIEDLRGALGALVAGQSPRAADGVAYLPIDRAFSIAGHGPVVTGTLRGAEIAEGDTLELFPSRSRIRVRALEVHGERAPRVAPGQRVAVNLRDIATDELKRGMVLAAPDALAPTEWLSLSIRATDDAPPLKNGMRLRALIGAQETDVRLRLLDRDALQPGDCGFAQLRFAERVATPAKEPVILRIASPARTVAGGRVLEPESRRQRRNCPTNLKRLEAIGALPPGDLIAAEVERLGPAGVSVTHLARLCALDPARVVDRLRTLPVVLAKTGVAVAETQMDRLLARIPALVAPHEAGLSYDLLLAALPGTSAPVLDHALGQLLSRGAISKRGGLLAIPRPHADEARANKEARLAAEVAETLRRGGLSPPDPSTLAPDPLTRSVVERLLREGVIVRAVDQAKGRAILFHRDAIEEAKRRLAGLLERADGLLVTEIGAALGTSRKYSMPLLSHLDSIRFTRRVKDRRIRGRPLSSVV